MFSFAWHIVVYNCHVKRHLKQLIFFLPFLHWCACAVASRLYTGNRVWTDGHWKDDLTQASSQIKALSLSFQRGSLSWSSDSAVKRQHWSAHMMLKHTLVGNIAIIQLLSTKIKCIIKIQPCWWTICSQILKVFASVHHVSMETHGVWLITETKSVMSVDSYV